jgi:hypothetical protein
MLISLCIGIIQLPMEESSENEWFTIPKCMAMKCLNNYRLVQLVVLLQLIGHEQGMLFRKIYNSRILRGKMDPLHLTKIYIW